MIVHVKGIVTRANVVHDAGSYDENKHIRSRKPFVSAVLMIRVTHIPINDSIEFVPVMEAKNTEAFDQLYRSSFDSEFIDNPFIEIVVSAFEKELPKNYSSQCLALVREGDLIKAELSVKESEGLLAEPNHSIIWLNILPRELS